VGKRRAWQAAQKVAGKEGWGVAGTGRGGVAASGGSAAVGKVGVPQPVEGNRTNRTTSAAANVPLQACHAAAQQANQRRPVEYHANVIG